MTTRRDERRARRRIKKRRKYLNRTPSDVGLHPILYHINTIIGLTIIITMIILSGIYIRGVMMVADHNARLNQSMKKIIAQGLQTQNLEEQNSNIDDVTSDFRPKTRKISEPIINKNVRLWFTDAKIVQTDKPQPPWLCITANAIPLDNTRLGRLTKPKIEINAFKEKSGAIDSSNPISKNPYPEVDEQLLTKENITPLTETPLIPKQVIKGDECVWITPGTANDKNIVFSINVGGKTLMADGDSIDRSALLNKQ